MCLCIYSHLYVGCMVCFYLYLCYMYLFVYDPFVCDVLYMYIYICVVCLCVILCCRSDMCLGAIYICVSMCVICVYTCDAFVRDHLCVLMTCKVCVVPVGVRMVHVCMWICMSKCGMYFVRLHCMSSDLGALCLVYTLAPTGAHSCTRHHHLQLERSEGSKLSLGKKKSKGLSSDPAPRASPIFHSGFSPRSIAGGAWGCVPRGDGAAGVTGCSLQIGGQGKWCFRGSQS